MEEPGREEQSFEKREQVQKREWEPMRLEIVEMKQEEVGCLEIEEGGRGWELQKEKREGLAGGLEAVVSHYCF